MPPKHLDRGRRAYDRRAWKAGVAVATTDARFDYISFNITLLGRIVFTKVILA
jgi:hypothetical protein